MMHEMSEAAGGRWSGVILVRHGESVWNVTGRVQGQSTDAPGLTDRGRRQMGIAALSLGRSLVGAGPVRVVSSDLRRTMDSAAIIADQLGVAVHADAQWRERSFGVLEGSPAPPPAAETGVAGEQVVDPDCAPIGGETIRQLAQRVARALEWVQGAGMPGTGVPETGVGAGMPGTATGTGMWGTATGTGMAGTGTPGAGVPGTGVQGAGVPAGRAGSGSTTIVVTHGGVVRVASSLCAGADVGRMTWSPVGNAAVVRLPLFVWRALGRESRGMPAVVQDSR